MALWMGCARSMSGAHIPAERPGVGAYCSACGALRNPPRWAAGATTAPPAGRSPLPRPHPPGRAPRNPRSDEAWASQTPERLTAREAEIVGILRERPSTTFEVEQITGGKHQSVSATISGLYHKKRAIRPSGAMRPTDTGRMADVYEVGDPEAPDAPRPPRRA